LASVAILGVGRMGAAMARKLAEAGHCVSLWNRTSQVADDLAAEIGATSAASPADAVRGADVVISILSSGAVTETVLLDPTVMDALAADTVVCDMATSGVATAHRLNREFAARGIDFVDAPVSGSTPTIAAGQLLVMASGSEKAVGKAEPVLAAFSKRVSNLGEPGAGQAMKLSVNLVVHTLNSAVSEGLALASSAGIAPSDAYDIFLDSVVAAPFVNYKRAAFLDPGTPVAMSLELTHKDLRLITAFAAEQGVDTIVADAVRTEVGASCEAGFGESDMAALARFLGAPTAES